MQATTDVITGDTERDVITATVIATAIANVSIVNQKYNYI